MSDTPSHVLALYDRAIIICATQPYPKLQEAFMEIKALYPQYPMPYAKWAAEITKRHQAANGVEMADAPGPYDKPGVERPAIGQEMVQVKKDALVVEKCFNDSRK